MQFKYQSYLKLLVHDKNSSCHDKCEYFYHTSIFTLKRHENFTKNLLEQEFSSGGDEQVLNLIIRKGKFYY